MKEAKEYAKELVERFEKWSMSYWNEISGWDENSRRQSAIQCALICVEEKMETILSWSKSYMGRKQMEYLEQVKQEIELL